MTNKTPKEPLRRFVFLIDPVSQKYIDTVMDNTNCQSIAEVLRRSLETHAKKIMPDYLKPSETPRPVYATPEDRMKAKIEKAKQDAEAKKLVEFEEKSTICKLLDGTAIDYNGNFNCKYKIYDKASAKRVFVGSREVPFDMLHDSHLDAQFKNGMKEDILKIVAEHGEN